LEAGTDILPVGGGDAGSTLHVGLPQAEVNVEVLVGRCRSITYSRKGAERQRKGDYFLFHILFYWF
jgi:hypothetical protein